MAVIMGNALGARVAWDQLDDNVADRLLALDAQIGRPETLVPGAGTVLAIAEGQEIVEMDVSLNVLGDGVADGTNHLTSVSGPWTRAMVGLSLAILGHGQRTITAYHAAGDIEFSGSPIAAATGLRFTWPLGLVAFDDGVLDGLTLTSVSAPFSADLVGGHVNIDGIGIRHIDTYVGDDEVTVDGAPVVYRNRLRFTLPVTASQAEHSLSTTGGQIVDGHRLPALATATTLRWRLGDRARRGTPRTLS